MAVRTSVAGLAALVLAAAAWVAADPASAGPAPARDNAAGTPTAPAAAVGAAGCSATGCHGKPSAPSLVSPPDDDTWRSSFTHFRAVDPHTNAYPVLHGDLAAQIVALMAGTDERGEARKHLPASQDVRCLACHTNPALAKPDADLGPAGVAMKQDGVSCEACHANAGRWLPHHTTLDTPEQRVNAYREYGMYPLYDLGERALMCAGCHVGAPADPARGYPVRDMNHDMIAAGHPRLEFDFADFQRRLPPHWFERERTKLGDPPRGPDLDARAWLNGRVATAEAAYRLTADRAARAQADPAATPWPELAEYNCFACHHDLPEAWREKPAHYAGRKPGSPPWQSLSGVVRSPNNAERGNPVGEFLKAIERPRPSPADVQAKATAAADEMTQTRRLLDVMSTASLLNEAMPRKADEAKLDGLNWDQSAQLFYRLAAVERTREAYARAAGKNPDDPAILDKFKLLRAALTLPRQPQEYNSPYGYTPEKVRTTFRELQPLLADGMTGLPPPNPK